MWPAPACAWEGQSDRNGSRGVGVSSRAPWKNTSIAFDGRMVCTEGMYLKPKRKEVYRYSFTYFY
jgi:hypothetical protein